MTLFAVPLAREGATLAHQLPQLIDGLASRVLRHKNTELSQEVVGF